MRPAETAPLADQGDSFAAVPAPGEYRPVSHAAAPRPPRRCQPPSALADTHDGEGRLLNLRINKCCQLKPVQAFRLEHPGTQSPLDEAFSPDDAPASQLAVASNRRR